MKKSLFALSLAAGLLTSASDSFASTVANDKATNSPYVVNSTFSGQNGGTGFLAWSVTGSNGTGGTFGNYVGTTGLGATTFGIYSGDINTGAFANAVRPFNGALAAGQTFSVDLGNTTVGTNGLIGLSLQNSSGTTEINLQTGGGSWLLNAGGANITLSTDTTGSDFHFSLTYNGGSSYSYTFTGSANGTNLTATNTISGITQANFFDSQQGSNQNFGFTNLAIVPEPTTWGMVVLGGAGAFLVIRRRRFVA